jgi:hypothetical protein
MRRLCLFVHTPVTPSLGLGVNSIAIGDLFTPHALKLDEELFPLLLEAKPCVILASIADSESSAAVYNLMREFKEFRMSNGSAARDPGLRIVIVSEGQIPRLNWASLGIYELIIGPVQANVLTYKLNRHYHKAIDAGDPEPDTTPANLLKDVEMKAEASSTPEWKTFTSSPLEKLQTRVFKKSETEVKEISLRVAIPGLNPAAGKWKKSDVQMDPPPEWNWEYSQETPEGPTKWSFRGEEPVYHPEDGTWQFISTLPKLLSYGRNTTGIPDVQFEYLPKPSPDGEGKLNVKADLQVKSIRTQTYSEPNSDLDPLIVDDSKKIAENEISQDEIAAAMADLENAILEKKQNYGAMPREREKSAGPGWGKAPDLRGEDSGANSDANSADAKNRTREKLKPNYGEVPRERDLDPESNAANEKKKRSAREGLKPHYPPLRELAPGEEASEADSEAKPKGLEKNKDFPLQKERETSSPDSSNANRVSAQNERNDAKKSSEPADEPLGNEFTKQKGSLSKDLEHSAPKKHSSIGGGPDESTPKIAPKPFPLTNPQSTLKKNPSLRDEINFASNPIINGDTPARAGVNLQSRASEETSEAHKKSFSSEKTLEKNSTRIQKDEDAGSLSALYDDDEDAKAKAKRKEQNEVSTDIELFDEHIWKFRMVKRANLVKNQSTGALAQKTSLAPQQKLSLEEKRSIVDRILRFIVEFFTRQADE